MTRRRRRYTEAEKQAALSLNRDKGPSHVERVLGIPKGTVSAWAKQAGIPTVRNEKTAAATEAAAVDAARLRADLRVKLLVKAHDLLDRMDEEHVDFRGTTAYKVTFPKAPAGAVQNYATSVGILIDKLRLEEGGATDRHEHLNADRLIEEGKGRVTALFERHARTA
jgi:transposase-like protein